MYSVRMWWRELIIIIMNCFLCVFWRLFHYYNNISLENDQIAIALLKALDQYDLICLHVFTIHLHLLNWCETCMCTDLMITNSSCVSWAGFFSTAPLWPFWDNLIQQLILIYFDHFVSSQVHKNNHLDKLFLFRKYTVINRCASG